MNYFQISLAVFSILYCVFYQYKVAEKSLRNRPTVTAKDVTKRMISGCKYQLLFILSLAVLLIVTQGPFVVSLIIIALQTAIFFSKPKLAATPVATLEPNKKEEQ